MNGCLQEGSLGGSVGCVGRRGVRGWGQWGDVEAQGLGTLGKVPSCPLSWDCLNPALAPSPELKLA